MAAYVQDSIMLFGDSITQGGWDEGGFGAKMTHVYARKLDVLNRGLSGYNTDWAMPLFEKVRHGCNLCLDLMDDDFRTGLAADMYLSQFLATQEQQKTTPKVRLLVIWFGANDACIKPSPQHVPITKFISNLKRMVNMVQSPRSEYYSAETRIILVTPPPVNEYQRKEDLESRTPPKELDRLFDTTKEYAEAVKDVAREEEVAVVDIWTGLWDAAGREQQQLSRYLNDGLHLNAAGYGIMYEKLIETIGRIYPELHPDSLKYVFPRWDEIPGVTLGLLP
ncbi:isoamyl acetate-hydrolyzing esterase [Paramarasmius palmivorus]|uniref:Isoamyl acetate-hydrolyzing esterase n=1 Tax=Paramarasmius palmivorus TaxID=297713 RepID=A0AAW0DVS7_9AGAR